MMSTYSVSVSVTASIPRQNSFAAEMGDKTPPYVPDYPEPSSKIVRTNSFFYQSLVRELSESSLLLVSSVRPADKEWVCDAKGTAKTLDVEENCFRKDFPDEINDLRENEAPVDKEGGLSNSSVEITMETPDNVEGSATEFLEDNSFLQEKATAEENSTLEIPPMESPEDVSNVKKRPRTLSVEEAQAEPTTKRYRNSASESDAEDPTGDEEITHVDTGEVQSIEIGDSAAVGTTLPVELETTQEDPSEGAGLKVTQEVDSTQVMQKPSEEISSMEITSDEPTLDIADVTPKDSSRKRPRTLSDSSEPSDTGPTTPSLEESNEPSEKRLRSSATEPEADCSTEVGVVGSESEPTDSEVKIPNSEPGIMNGEEDESLIDDSQDEESNSKETDKEVEKQSDKSVQNSSPTLALNTQSPSTVMNNKCSICGRLNCPLNPNRQTTNTSFSSPKTPLVKRLKSSGKAKSLKKYSQSKKMNSAKTPVRRSIGTRSSAEAIRRRTPNHSPLQIKKLKTQLFKGVEMGDLDLVREVIQETGASVRREKTGCTLLHVAASHNQVDVVMFLLKLISPNITNKEGQTPAHVAAVKGHTQVLRILMDDPDFDPDKRDSRRNTIKTLVDDLLFEAVLKGDLGQVKRLMNLGADPDSFRRNQVNKTLARELGVSTPRQLAQALNMKPIVTLFAKKGSSSPKNGLDNSSVAAQNANIEDLRMSTRQFNVKASSTYVGGEDVYKMDRETRGRVYLLNLSSFEKRPDLDLPQLDYDARLLSDVFGNMGYACETYSGLTAQHTKQMLRNVREAEALSEAGCAIFIVSGYSVNGNGILTSDLKALDVDSVCRLFKDSECPGLKRKPKLFLFNLYHVSSVSGVSPSERPKSMRVEEPVSDTAVLFCKSFGLHRVGKGTGFSSSLCRTLADHAHDKELGDVYREFLTQYTASFPDVVPELRYLGFTKKFFFNPVKH